MGGGPQTETRPGEGACLCERRVTNSDMVKGGRDSLPNANAIIQAGMGLRNTKIVIMRLQRKSGGEDYKQRNSGSQPDGSVCPSNRQRVNSSASSMNLIG